MKTYKKATVVLSLLILNSSCDSESERLRGELSSQVQEVEILTTQIEAVSGERDATLQLLEEKSEAMRFLIEEAEADRLAMETAHADSLAAHKARADRLAVEKAEGDRMAAEEAAAERFEAEREALLADRAAAAERAAKKVADERALYLSENPQVANALEGLRDLYDLRVLTTRSYGAFLYHVGVLSDSQNPVIHKVIQECREASSGRDEKLEDGTRRVSIGEKIVPLGDAGILAKGEAKELLEELLGEEIRAVLENVVCGSCNGSLPEPEESQGGFGTCQNGSCGRTAMVQAFGIDGNTGVTGDLMYFCQTHSYEFKAGAEKLGHQVFTKDYDPAIEDLQSAFDDLLGVGQPEKPTCRDCLGTGWRRLSVTLWVNHRSVWYYANGQKQLRTPLTGLDEQGRPSKLGRSTHWYKNGQIKETCFYSHGDIVGQLTQWHENGRKKLEGDYLGGRKSGFWTAWDAGGNIVSEVEYDEGIEIGRSEKGERVEEEEREDVKPVDEETEELLGGFWEAVQDGRKLKARMHRRKLEAALSTEQFAPIRKAYVDAFGEE